MVSFRSFFSSAADGYLSSLLYSKSFIIIGSTNLALGFIVDGGTSFPHVFASIMDLIEGDRITVSSDKKDSDK